ncbi:MAG TPA: sulfatase [Sphingomicrobium sp.]|nr:sulfatase [Sphingomicrobium sp.]
MTPKQPLRLRPNMIFIMTDDHAQSALSSYGNAILKTPNLDRIGADGVRFTEAFVTNSLCLPSRATYLTGLYSHAHGQITNGEESGFMDEPRLNNAVTWPNLLRSAGYYTGVVGKWHVNTPPMGYDYSAVLPGQGVYFDPPITVQGRESRGNGHTDDVIGEQALGFLGGRPSDRPFALLFQFKAPHRGWEPAPRFAKAFADTEIPPPADLYETLASKPVGLRLSEMRLADMLDYRDRGVRAEMPEKERARLNFQHFIKDYYRVLLGVDENVGRLLDYLDRQGLSENTLIVYTSDNGFFLGEIGLFDKRLMYEPSIRVPMLVRHPASIQAGQVNREHMLLNVDVAPTFLDAGSAVAAPAMQGRSWLSIAQGRRPSNWRKDFLYQYFEFPAAHCVRKHRGVRTERWKLIHWDYPQAWELYDLASDPHEKRNLTGLPKYAAQEAKLRARLAELRRELGDVDPPGYVPGDPLDLKHCQPVPNPPGN